MHTWGRGGWRGVLGWVGRVLGGVHSFTVSLTLWYSVFQFPHPASHMSPMDGQYVSRFRHVSSCFVFNEAGAKPARSRAKGREPREAG